MTPTKEQWILCPICGAKTRARLLPDTVLRNFPLFCPKCKRESIIDVQNYEVTVLRTCKADKSSITPFVRGPALQQESKTIPRQAKPQPDAKTQC